MKVRLYDGALKLVEKSGVGQAIHHQAAMLREAGVDVTRKNEPDVDAVHINTVFPDSILAAVMAKKRGQRVIYYGHSTMEDFRDSFRLSNQIAPFFRKWIRFCYQLGDVIVTPTEYSRRLLQSYGIQRPIVALSNGVDTALFAYRPEYRAAFRERFHLSEEEKVVVSVGHFIQRKGITDFIQLAREMPETRFYWFGYTNRNLITTEVREQMEKKPDNLEFPGFISQTELRDAYCGSDLFCFMSREETEGIVVLEALASGIPVLLRDIPVYEGWLEDGVNVWKASDQQTFRERAAAILEGALPDLTAAGRRTAEERSLKTMGERLLSMYERRVG